MNDNEQRIVRRRIQYQRFHFHIDRELQITGLEYHSSGEKKRTYEDHVDRIFRHQFHLHRSRIPINISMSDGFLPVHSQAPFLMYDLKTFR